MAWVKIDDDFYLHPKLAKAGPLALAMQVAALCYSNHYRTKGFVPFAVVPRLLDLRPYARISESPIDPDDSHVSGWRILAEDLAEALLDAGMWEDAIGRNGYLIHDYAQYQLEATADATRREAKVRAGRAGGLAKASRAKQEPSTAIAKPSPVPVPVPVPLLRSALSDDPSDHPSEPPPALRVAVEAFTSADPKTQVARLVDLGDAMGLPRNGGLAASIVRDYGHGLEVVRALTAAGTEAKGDPWEYTKGALKHAKTRKAGLQPSGDRPFVSAGDRILTPDEYHRLLREKQLRERRPSVQAAGSGDGLPAPPDDAGVLPG